MQRKRSILYQQCSKNTIIPAQTRFCKPNKVTVESLTYLPQYEPGWYPAMFPELCSSAYRHGSLKVPVCNTEFGLALCPCRRTASTAHSLTRYRCCGAKRKKKRPVTMTTFDVATIKRNNVSRATQMLVTYCSSLRAASSVSEIKDAHRAQKCFIVMVLI